MGYFPIFYSRAKIIGCIFGEDKDDTMSFEEVIVSDDHYITLLNDEIRKKITR